MAPSQKTTVTSLGEHLPQESTGTPTHATLHPSRKSHPPPSHSRLSAERSVKPSKLCFFVLFLELIHPFHPVLTGS